MQDRPTCSLLGKRGDVGRRRMLSARRERGQENGTGARSPACRDGELGLLRGPGVFRLFFSEPWKRLGGVREAACRCVRAPGAYAQAPARASAFPCVCAFAPPGVRARAFPCVPASQGCWRKAWDGLSAPPSVQPNIFCIGHQKVL